MPTKPATPLPWEFAEGSDNSLRDPQTLADECVYGSVMGDGEWHIARVWSDGAGPKEDAAYLVHACNAYPRLVYLARAFLPGSGITILQMERNAAALLRELGELE